MWSSLSAPFSAELLASEENLLGLMAVNRELVARAEEDDESERVVLDMDSTESPVHGQQEGSAYNGHFESTCYHPLLLFNQHGDCLAAKLRAGSDLPPQVVPLSKLGSGPFSAGAGNRRYRFRRYRFRRIPNSR